MVKVEFVKAEFKKIYEQKKVQIPTGEKHKSFFGLLEIDEYKEEEIEEVVGASKSEIDGVKLAEDISRKVNVLELEGYKIKQIVPIVSGEYNYSSRTSLDGISISSVGGLRGEGSYGYGYSFTEGVLIYAEK